MKAFGAIYVAGQFNGFFFYINQSILKNEISTDYLMTSFYRIASGQLSAFARLLIRIPKAAMSAYVHDVPRLSEPIKFKQHPLS